MQALLAIDVLGPGFRLGKISLLEMLIEQGGESRDLFLTCIRTERVRKLFSTSLILNEFSCSTMKVPCLHKQQMNIEVSYVMRCIFPHNLEHESLCSRVCRKIQRP